MKQEIKPVKIENRKIGPGYPVFIIAEIGFLFQSFERKGKFPGAKELIDAAVEAGADAIKIQTFKAQTLASPTAIFDMKYTGRIRQRELFKQYEIDEKNHKKIFDYAGKKGIILFSTPSHPRDVELLEKFDPPAYKVGSDDLVNIPFLRYIAKKGKPMIVSTGMSTLAEVKRSVKEIQKINKNVIILHCVSNYPALPKQANLKAIPILQHSLKIPVGWSDHTVRNNCIAFAAVTLGANVIEKHFTTDYENPSTDAPHSSDPIQFKEMVKGIRVIEKALGNGVKRPTETRNVFPQNRKSVVAMRDLEIGEVILLKNPYKYPFNSHNEKDIGISRPGFGLDPGLCDTGKKVRVLKPIKAWECIKKKDVEIID